MIINVFQDEVATQLSTAEILGQFKNELAKEGILGEAADSFVEMLAVKLIDTESVAIKERVKQQVAADGGDR